MLAERDQHPAQLPAVGVDQPVRHPVHRAVPERFTIDELRHEEEATVVLGVLPDPAEQVGLSHPRIAVEDEPGRRNVRPVLRQADRPGDLGRCRPMQFLDVIALRAPDRIRAECGAELHPRERAIFQLVHRTASTVSR
ncbi:hypothetical protein ACFC06_15035 [Nocardia sp. NPDC056064]|uniref:hypothetical protein n=1 Tax=Nocardia sp. NPDC056064 TaxID=3345701 RepID=UPI0035DB592A